MRRAVTRRVLLAIKAEAHPSGGDSGSLGGAFCCP
jgi:hypothetical protein